MVRNKRKKQCGICYLYRPCYYDRGHLVAFHNNSSCLSKLLLLGKWSFSHCCCSSFDTISILVCLHMLLQKYNTCFFICSTCLLFFTSTKMCFCNWLDNLDTCEKTAILDNLGSSTAKEISANIYIPNGSNFSSQQYSSRDLHDIKWMVGKSNPKNNLPLMVSGKLFDQHATLH